MSEEIPAGRRAPEGHVWRCAACGKWSEDVYGFVGHRSKGWDVSCTMNAVAVTDTPPWAGE